MPVGVVKTEADERKWEACKHSVREQGLTPDKDGDRYWRVVMGCFKRAKGADKAKSDFVEARTRR